MPTPQTTLDSNYRQVSTNLYDPISKQFVASQAGAVLTSADGTVYSVQAVTTVDGQKATYSAAINNLATAATATDIFTITGSATKTVRITRLEVSGIAGTIIDTTVRLFVRNAANSAGTAVPAVPHDSTNPAATATVQSYTANPTINSVLPGLVRASKVLFNIVAPATGSESGRLIEDYGDRPSQAIVLRGVAQVLAVNLNATTIVSPSLDISVEWSEDSFT